MQSLILLRMASRPPVTTADYMVVALSPTLIFFLVGSLCFYLVEVFYQGQYELRLLWVMLMFVMGIWLYRAWRWRRGGPTPFSTRPGWH